MLKGNNTCEEENGVTWAGYASLGWDVVFIVFHVYWALGGRIGFGDASSPLPSAPHSPEGWVFNGIVMVMFALGIVVPLALVQSWGRAFPRWALLAVCSTGSFVLLIRALASIIDDVSRSTGMLPNGITGMTYAQITGDSQVTAYTLWSGRAIDAYFLLGGVLYGLAAWYGWRQRFRAQSSVNA